MKSPFDDSGLRVVAAELAARHARESRVNFLARSAARIKTEILQGSTQRRVRFVKYAVRESVARLLKWTRGKRRREIHVDVPADRLLVAVRCNGCLGDLIIHSSFLDRFYREYGQPIIHVIVRSERMNEAAFAFRGSPAVAILTDAADLTIASTPYDVILSLAEFASYDFIRTERVKRIAPEVLEKLTAAQQIQLRYRPFIDAQPSFDGLFATAATKFGLRRLDLLGWLANVDFTQEHPLSSCPDAGGYRLFEDLGLAQRPYITIHNGWDNVTHRSTTSATKGWPVSHYERFVEGFKERFHEVAIVQLGARTSRPIAGTDISLLNGTTLHEAAWILKHSLLHIDGDSGLVHLSRALHTKSLVLFGPTNHDFFRYAQNETCFSTICNNCWWSTHDWMRSCPRGLEEPECMTSIEPSTVLELAGRHLRSRPSVRLKIERAAPWQGAGSREQGAGSFDDWRIGFVLDVLQTSQVTDADFRVAVVDDSRSSSQFAADGRQITTFTFSPGSPLPAPCYGSIYNIPAEDATFDAVVMPVLTVRVEHPYAAIKESLRLVRENGLLVLTYRFADSAARLRLALGDLGVAETSGYPAAGAIVFRKECGSPPQIPAKLGLHDSHGFDMKRLENSPTGAS
jgi:ADP-heptose:LPS heptosyltransferase